MDGTYIDYPKCGIDITSYDDHAFLGATFRHNNRVFLISTSTYEKDFVQYIRLMGDWKKEDGLLNSELELVTDNFFNGGLIYYLSKETSKKILNAYGIRYKGFFVRKLNDRRLYYYDWDNHMTIKGIMLPIICNEC